MSSRAPWTLALALVVGLGLVVYGIIISDWIPIVVGAASALLGLLLWTRRVTT